MVGGRLRRKSRLAGLFVTKRQRNTRKAAFGLCLMKWSRAAAAARER